VRVIWKARQQGVSLTISLNLVAYPGISGGAADKADLYSINYQHSPARLWQKTMLVTLKFFFGKMQKALT